jgi:uncharacterized protein (DUF2147 family)
MRLRLILLLACLSAPALAQGSPEGNWWTEDRSGVIAITPCREGLCGRIVGQPNIRDANGRIPLDVNGVPHCGLTILRGAPTGEEGVFRGTITNPDDGKIWHCEFWLGADGQLRLRGYVLLPLLGQTQAWTKFTGHLAKDCSLP